MTQSDNDVHLNSSDFRALFRAAPVPVLVLSPPHWVIVEANPARLTVTGTTREEQIGRKLFDVFPEDPADASADGVQKLTASLERVMATKAADMMTVQRYAIPNASGQFVERWWRPVNSPVLNDNDDVALIIHSVEDVTELVQLRDEAVASDQSARNQLATIDMLRTSEAVLRESDQRHRFRIDLSDALRELTSPSEIMAAVAERLGLFLGVDQANYYFVEGNRFVVTQEWRTDASLGILGSHLLADFGDGTVARLQAGEILRFDNTRGVEGEEAFAAAGMVAVLSIPLRSNGHWAAGLHVHQSDPRVWTDEEEALMREVAGYTWSAVERTRAQVELRELNESLEVRVADALAERRVLSNFVDSTDASVLACDMGYGVLAVNEATASKMERIYGVRLKVGDNLLEMLASMPEHRAQVEGHWKRALSGEEFVIVDEFGDPSRARAFFEVRFHPLRDNNGKQIGAFQAAHDVTDRVGVQAELEHAQEALRQSQKMEAMGQLTGGVAHDFNNLLTPIVGSLDMLQRSGLGGEREQRLIAGAIQSADRAKILVQRLLAFARRQPLQSTAVDVAGLVQGMADLMASTSGPQIAIVVEAADDLPSAQADPNQLEMALLNLCVNARDAMPDGGTLRITASCEDVALGHRSKLRSDQYILLSVADTGVGMDEETARRAIEPFFSTKGVGKGTGLGLSRVHGLALQLGGALTIQSQPAVGTNVELWLPISATVAIAHKPNVEPVSQLAIKGTALLVDDDDLVRMSTADMLAYLGYVVLEASSAEEATRMMEDGADVDVLVTDHLMSGMSGTELAGEVRRQRPTMPILVVSGYAEAEGIALDLPRLVKPFKQSDLATKLNELNKEFGL